VGTDIAWSNFANVEWFTVERSKHPESVSSAAKSAVRSIVSVASALSGEEFPVEALSPLNMKEG
jgi:hypothetical protein